MPTDVIAQFNDPSSAARFLGESVGTHYSAALRAAEAFGRHLAPARKALHERAIPGENLVGFWQEVLHNEGIRIGSHGLVKGLGATPDHFLNDFLDSADEAFRKRYSDAVSLTGRAPGKAEHENCLRFLRDDGSTGNQKNLVMRNKVATWLQLLRLTGGYQE